MALVSNDRADDDSLKSMSSHDIFKILCEELARHEEVWPGYWLSISFIAHSRTRARLTSGILKESRQFIESIFATIPSNNEAATELVNSVTIASEQNDAASTRSEVQTLLVGFYRPVSLNKGIILCCNIFMDRTLRSWTGMSFHR